MSDLLEAYTAELKLPWRQGISGSERVWMLVYPADFERSVRGGLDRLELATTEAGRKWLTVDITDAFGRWVGSHRYASAFFEDPSDLSDAMIDQFETELVATVRDHLAAAPADSVVALVGIGSIFPFLRASSLIKGVDQAVTGRLLVLFPGTHDPATHSFRLLDARDGFNYRARVIDPRRDLA